MNVPASLHALQRLRPPPSASRQGLRYPSLAWAGLLAAAAAGAQPVAPAASDVLEHRIEPGDTLIGLHGRLMRPDANWRRVQRLNRIKDPRRLQPGALLRIPGDLLREEPVSAEVLHSHGDVQLERAGQPAQPLAAAALVRAGDLIRTGVQSSVSLRFADGSRTLLGPGGQLRVQRHSKRGGGALDTQLQLDSGAVETRVTPASAPAPAPRFQLRTPVTNLGVRGTEFRARLDAQRLLAEVLEGRVSVGHVAVAAGQGTVATAGQVAPPRALSAAPDLSALPTRVEKLPLELRFGAVAGARRYRAQLFAAAEAGAAERLLLEGVFDSPQLSWPDTPPDGSYELRVRAADADGIEGRSSRLAFTLKARPEPPFQLRPRAGESLTDAVVVFAWSAHPQARSYRLQVAAQPDFANPVLSRTDLDGTELRAELPLGTWYWRVATERAGGDVGPWGDAVLLQRVPPPPPPPPPPAPPVEPPQAAKEGLVLRWAAAALPGARYQVQVARDASFAQTVLDETTTATERVLPSPEPGSYHVRVRTIAPDGRAGGYGATQVVEIPGQRWWLWLLLLPLIVP